MPSRTNLKHISYNFFEGLFRNLRISETSFEKNGIHLMIKMIKTTALFFYERKPINYNENKPKQPEEGKKNSNLFMNFS